MEDLMKNQDYRSMKYGSPKDISNMFGIPTGTLANWRYLKIGPQYFKRQKKIFYKIDDVEAWINRYPVKTTESI